VDVERLIVPIRLLLSMPVRSRVHGPAPTLLQRWTGWDGDEPGRWRRLLPRPETTLILLSLGWTIAAKSKVLGGQQPESLFASVVESTLPDVAFFATMLALFSGLFLFGRGAPNRFVMFENQTSRAVKIVHDGRIHELGVTEQRGALVTGESFRRVYLDSAHNLTFTLPGEVGEETGSGPRLVNVLLTVRALDASRVVRPLGGVRSCREAQG